MGSVFIDEMIPGSRVNCQVDEEIEQNSSEEEEKVMIGTDEAEKRDYEKRSLAQQYDKLKAMKTKEEKKLQKIIL